MYKKIYMICTADKYQLPIFWAETVQDLARMSGRSYDTVYHGIGRFLRGQKSTYEVVRVEGEQDD